MTPAEGLKKYLLYAIGEILLVMIGILLALEVNNWNEERKERALEKSILANILKGLRTDSVDIEFNINAHKECLKSQKLVIAWIEGNQPFPDSLKRHISISMRFTQFVGIEEPYESLKKSGTQLVRNDSLRERISSLFDLSYDLYEEHEKLYTRMISKMISDINQDYFDVSNPVVFGKPGLYGAMTPKDPNRLRTDNRFAYHLRTCMVENEMFIFYSMLRLQKKLDQVKDMIRRELNR